MAANRTDEILTFAEHEMRRGGFDAVSFRDIAAAVGIKSASVHYHFPTKADLGREVAKRYADRFMSTLGSPGEPDESRRDRIERLCDAYIAAYRPDFANCLCAVLGSVPAHIPQSTAHQVMEFYGRLTDWTEAALGAGSGGLTASVVISLLQGAMTLAVATGNEKPLVEAKAYLMTAVALSSAEA